VQERFGRRADGCPKIHGFKCTSLRSQRFRGPSSRRARSQLVENPRSGAGPGCAPRIFGFTRLNPLAFRFRNSKPAAPRLHQGYGAGALDGLTLPGCQRRMCEMVPITTREFVRHFARLKRAAANGEELVVRDRKGQAFVFRAKGAGPTLGEQLSDLRGSLRTGVRVKSLKGFGRKRA
jgi:hypothetical protein